VLTVRRLSLGAGFDYLMKSIAVGDEPAPAGSSLAAYYEASGTPPGQWLGAGLATLGDGESVRRGDAVTEEQLYRMLGLCVDPLSGEPRGRTPNAQRQPLAARVDQRMADLDPWLSADQRAAARERFVGEERARERQPVAGFDLTFSPQKSVSVAWGLADAQIKARMYECHHRAIEITLECAERDVFRSRSGVNGVVEEQVEGVTAAAFSHYDSRSGDPLLHDHVVVWNRAPSVSDGKWRTLDSRGLYRQVVTLSEIYDGVLEDLLSAELGVGWRALSTRNGQRKVELQGVEDALIAEFSQRRAEIDAAEDELTRAFIEQRGHAPSPAERRRIAQRANLATRQPKSRRSLQEMTEAWRERAASDIPDPVGWTLSLQDRCDLPALRSDQFTPAMVADLAAAARDESAQRRSTFTRANVLAEAHRQLRGVRFDGYQQRLALAEQVADVALSDAVMVTAPELHHVPGRYLTSEGDSRLRPAAHARYTTEALLDAEQRLLDAGRQTDGPRVSTGAVARITAENLPGRGYALSTDQAVAVEAIAGSGRTVDVLVGPAGTGKSTTMAGLAAVWEAEHAAGSVLGLAPSAAAADVLGGELGTETENTAKWLHEHRRADDRRERLTALEASGDGQAPAAQELRRELERWSLRRGQLVIVDEASLASTFTLEELTAAAQYAGAKVLLVGDPHQLSAVDAGGMFRALVADRDSQAPALADVRRFRSQWEKDASLRLRAGKRSVIDVYEREKRITAGDRDELVAALYEAWRRDVDAGLSSLMIAGDAATVAELSRRARADRVAAGTVVEHGVEVAGGQHAGVGDEVVTRQNDRRLRTERGWVKNGDRWIVTRTHPDGSLTARRASGGGTVELPAEYVAEHVELAYATTAHRAQGRTVDTAHAMVSAASTREVLYVAATRGRQRNQIYVDVAYDPDAQTGHAELTERQTARAVLRGVLERDGAELSAHAEIRASQQVVEGLPRLAAEYLTLARDAQAERWTALVNRCGLPDATAAQIQASDAYGPCVAAFRDAEARGLDIQAKLPALAAARDLKDAEDPAAVLHWRVQEWTRRAGAAPAPAGNLIAGLIPRAGGVSDPDLARALSEREQAIERRAAAVLADALERHAEWVTRLGAPPRQPAARTAWLREARTVAAYLDRWGEEAGEASTIEQQGHLTRARDAIARANQIAQRPGPPEGSTRARDAERAVPEGARPAGPEL
jgi:conjugative relaxase-like TrwC/TraI family protein